MEEREKKTDKRVRHPLTYDGGPGTNAILPASGGKRARVDRTNVTQLELSIFVFHVRVRDMRKRLRSGPVVRENDRQ